MLGNEESLPNQTTPPSAARLYTKYSTAIQYGGQSVVAHADSEWRGSGGGIMKRNSVRKLQLLQLRST